MDLILGKKSRDKGARFEREIVESARVHGLECGRVPLSGALPDHPGDVALIDAHGDRWLIEAKKRADGFRQIYGWLDAEADMLVIGADRQPALAVIPLDDFLAVLAR